MTHAMNSRFLGQRDRVYDLYSAPSVEWLRSSQDVDRSSVDEEHGTRDNEHIDEHGQVFQLRKPGEDEGGIKIEFAGRPYQLHISRGVDTAARVIMSIIAGIFLLAPVFAISYIDNKIYRLLTTSLSTFLFAVCFSVTSSAKNQEIMIATAAYTAVLVVFLGQTS